MKPLLRTACAALTAAALLPARADADGWRPDAAFTQLGAGRTTEAWSAGLQWRWSREWRWGAASVTGHWEFAAGRWRAELDADRTEWAWVTQLSAVPSLRVTSPGGTWYGEGGTGPSLIVPLYRSRDASFSTRFNFQSHLAVGYVWGERGEHDVSAHIEHYSNAGIRDPNPGVDLLSLRYTLRF